MCALQEQLKGLEGTSSGYIESLPASVQRRILSLKKLAEENEALEKQMQEELLALERRFAELHAPIYAKRGTIINVRTRAVGGGRVDERLWCSAHVGTGLLATVVVALVPHAPAHTGNDAGHVRADRGRVQVRQRGRGRGCGAGGYVCVCVSARTRAFFCFVPGRRR